LADDFRDDLKDLARLAALDAIDVSAKFAVDVATTHTMAAIAKAKSHIDAVIAAQVAPKPPTPPTPPHVMVKPRFRWSDNAERSYERGQRSLDNGRWDEALEAFTAVAAKVEARADGALYWKAYTLNKLGRRDEALGAIAELRKTHANSRWLDDAKVLEAELRQSSGQAVRPESEVDDEIKLLALNGLVQSDPERAVPLLENLLKGSQRPKLKERVLFVLAQSSSPRGKQLLEQVARGSAGNPDLQLKAIRYLGATGRKQSSNGGLLWEIYSASNDQEVKRAVLSGFISSNDKDHLLQIARTEKSPNLRLEAIGMLGAVAAQPELWSMYQQESSAEIKQQILHSMVASNSADRLAEVARTEKDVKLRRSAIRALSGMSATKSGDTLVALYPNENDPQVKSAIIDGLSGQRNAKALVDLARKESNPSMKREIVSRLSGMKSKEASDYLMELLK
jgi:tetratricopeptide (TPR) repeat protein